MAASTRYLCKTSYLAKLCNFRICKRMECVGARIRVWQEDTHPGVEARRGHQECQLVCQLKQARVTWEREPQLRDCLQITLWSTILIGNCYGRAQSTRNGTIHEQVVLGHTGKQTGQAKGRGTTRKCGFDGEHSSLPVACGSRCRLSSFSSTMSTHTTMLPVMMIMD